MSHKHTGGTSAARPLAPVGAAVAVLALALIAGCGHDGTVTPAKNELTGAAGEQLAKTPIQGYAQVDPSGTQVNVMAEYGGCQRPPRLIATATDTTVKLTLYQVNVPHPHSPCPAYMRLGRAGVLLSAPLGKRTLTDTVTGRTLPYFDGKRLAKTTYLPSGYAESGTVAGLAEPGNVTDSGVSWTRRYAPLAGKPGEPFLLQQTVHQSLAPEAPPAGGRPITVHGKPGAVLADGTSVVWYDGGYKFVLTAQPGGASPGGSPRSGSPLTVDELTRVANGVTLPS